MTIHFAAVPVIMICAGLGGIFISWIAGLGTWGYSIFGFFVFLLIISIVAVALGAGMQIGAWAGVR